MTIELRVELIATAREMNRSGINQGTSGNLSLRCDDGLLITPSGMPYERLEPADIVFLPLDGGDPPAAPGVQALREWPSAVTSTGAPRGAGITAHPGALRGSGCLRRRCRRFTTWWPSPAARHRARLMRPSAARRCPTTWWLHGRDAVPA
jgi:hypothetical protein